jgi:hypothetical protein
MTPTLLGRWQTRFLLLSTVGIIITIVFYFKEPSPNYFFILLYVLLFGIGWDLVYDHLQKLRWDHDFPATLQLLAGIWEGLFIIVLANFLKFLPLPQSFNLSNFLWHYSTVWIAVFTTSQTLMRVIFLRWRFRGGEWM